MKVEQAKWSPTQGWQPTPGILGNSAQLVMLFGSRAALSNSELMALIQHLYPSAHLMGCSTAGEICDVEVSDDTLVLTAIEFEQTAVKGHAISIYNAENSFHAGEILAQKLDQAGLTHIFVLSDGLKVNGSELVRGLVKQLPSGVTITGGLSGDGANFEKTLVLWDSDPETDRIAAIGLYGNRLTVGCGSWGGWDTFGPERLVTKSEGNVLHKLDGKSALELYKEYLGEHAVDLPASGLLFPLSLRTHEEETSVVRTILAVDETEQTMTFAGDIPEGTWVRLMKANYDRLVDGAIEAAERSFKGADRSPDLAVCISCVGRKLVLKQRVEEEIEGIREVLGDETVLTGFYSYGEIAPFEAGVECSLHNQTMTITTFTEN